MDLPEYRCTKIEETTNQTKSQQMNPVLVFGESRQAEYLGEKKKRDTTATESRTNNSSYIWCQGQKLNLGQIGRRQVLLLVCQDCSCLLFCSFYETLWKVQAS